MDDETLKYIGPLWEKLDGGLWHTTRRDRFDAILKSGGIDPEPESVPDNERYGTIKGPESYPLVRHLGGVSLFDFTGFEIGKYSEEFPSSSWAEFLPFRRTWESAVWIGVDRKADGLNLISAEELKEIAYSQEGMLARNRMPQIEVGNLGRVPISAFTAAWLVSADKLEELPLSEGTSKPVTERPSS